MIVYVVAAGLSAFLAVILKVRSATGVDFRRVATYVPLLPYLLVAVLRSDVGRDTVGESSTYPRVFALVQSGYSYEEIFRSTHIEPIYYLLNWFAVAAGAELFAVYAVMSAIFLIFMYRFILERSSNIPLSLLLLFASDLYMFALSGIRQAAACGIAFYALKYAHERRARRYFTWIAVAVGFHFTALIFIIFYFVARRRLSLTTVTLLLGSGVALMLAPDAVRRFSGIYYGIAYFGSKWDYSNFNLIPAVAAAIVVSAAVARSRQLIDRDPAMQLYLNIMVLNLFLMAISSLLITPVRLYFLLIPAAFVLIPATIDTVPRSRGPIRLIFGCALIAAVSLQLLYELSIDNDAYGTWDYLWVLGNDLYE